MSAPPLPVQELDPEDLVSDFEERSTSHTRRMGSNAQAAFELKKPEGDTHVTTGTPGMAAAGAPAPGTAPNAPGAAAPAGAIKPAAGLPAGAPPIADPTSTDGSGVPLSKPYLAGDVIAGKYKLTRIIGRGGMGAVWQAHNIPLDIDVAIKLIRRDRTAAGAADRLLTEARAAARLMHPAIVRVFDFGESEQGDPFIVMELLHGESLSAILRRKKRITPAVAVQTLLPVASALVSAHGKGIVHRDLKPDNIIIITHENGALQPKIVDFGIAKLLDMDRQVTLAGEVLGSPDYMSPEQARGADNVGEATDIWAFSVVLYEALTGARPFDGANYNALIASILTTDPRPITVHGVNDGALASIISHGLEKDVGHRWPRMRDLGAALATWATSHGIEDDVTGNSIAKQWLAGAYKRLLTVQPADFSALAAMAAAVPAPGSPSPGAAPPFPPAAIPALPPPRPAMETMVGKPRRAPRLLWVAPLVAILGVVGTALFLFRGRIEQLVEEQLSPSAAPSATAAPVESAATAPSATAAPAANAEPSAAPSAAPSDVPAASASASGAASGVGSGRPNKPIRKTKGAPQAPKHIKF